MDFKTIENDFKHIERAEIQQVLLDYDVNGLPNIARLMRLYKEMNINPLSMSPEALITEKRLKKLTKLLFIFSVHYERDGNRVQVLYDDNRDYVESKSDYFYLYIKERFKCKTCGKQIAPFSWPLQCRLHIVRFEDLRG